METGTLVGRAAELERMAKLLGDAAAGQPCALLVSGEVSRVLGGDEKLGTKGVLQRRFLFVKLLELHFVRLGEVCAIAERTPTTASGRNRIA